MGQEPGRAGAPLPVVNSDRLMEGFRFERIRTSSAEINVANRGEEKLMAVALASGIRLNAMSRKVCEQPCEAERARWWRSRRVRNTAKPVCGMMNSAQATSATAVRVNRTSPIG